MIIKAGRQMAPTLAGIRDDHVNRYKFAGDMLYRFTDEQIVVGDVGCGFGYGSFILAVEYGFCVISMDIDQGALDYGEVHYPHELVERRQIDFDDCNLPELTGVVAFEVLEHLENPGSLLSSMIEAGALHLTGSVPNQNVVPFNEKVHDRHYRHYTPDEIKLLLESTGWHVCFLGGQRGKHRREANVIERTDKCRTIVFAAMSQGLA